MNNVYHLKLNKFVERISPVLVQLFDFSEGQGYQCERLADFLRKIGGQYIELTIKLKLRPKSREALGFYFGGILRAGVLESHELPYQPETLAEDWLHYRKKGLVKLKEIYDIDFTLRYEFHYEYKMTMRGQVRTAKALADKDNPELLNLIDKVMLWRDEQGLVKLDPEKYKKNRDSARLKRGYVKKEVEYPKEVLQPKF